MNTPSTNSSIDGSKMKFVHFHNEFPNDDLKDLYRRLLNHSKDKKHLILAGFLDEATSVIREEVRKLPRALKDLVPPFESILNFVDHESLRKGPLGGSVEGLLLCVLEIATFIGYVHGKEYNVLPLTCLASMKSLLMSMSLTLQTHA